MRRALSEALLVALLGLIAGLGANFISLRGLSLSRDYFPARDMVSSGATASPSTVRSLPRDAETKVAVTPPLVADTVVLPAAVVVASPFEPAVLLTFATATSD